MTKRSDEANMARRRRSTDQVKQDDNVGRTEASASGGVQSVEIAFRLIEALGSLGRPAPLREIAQASGLSLSAAHRYLVSLIRVGIIVQEHRGGMYDLGPGALNLGLTALSRLDHQGHALETLDLLHAQVGHTVGLIVWGSHGPTIVRWKEADRAVTVNARPGHALPVCRSASGRVFAAFLSHDVIEPFVAAELAGGRGKARKTFDAVCERVREEHVSIIRGELVPGIDALAVPVFDHDDALRFVLSAWGSDTWIDVSSGGAIHLAFAKAGQELSASLGYRRAYPVPDMQ